MFIHVTAKLGNMRKAAEFTIYPYTEGAPFVTIQSDNRFARIDLATGKCVLSAGRKGANSIDLAMPGRMVVDVPAEVLADLKAQMAKRTDALKAKGRTDDGTFRIGEDS